MTMETRMLPVPRGMLKGAVAGNGASSSHRGNFMVYGGFRSGCERIRENCFYAGTEIFNR